MQKHKTLVRFLLKTSVVTLFFLSILITLNKAEAENPTMPPPEGPVTPTFSGLVVDGLSSFNGAINAVANVTLGDPDIGGADIIDIKGYLLNSLIIGGQDIPLLIADHILVGGHSTIIGDLMVQGTSILQGATTMAGDATVNGDTFLLGNTTLGNAGTDSITVDGSMRVNKVADFRGGVKNENGGFPFIIFDSLFVQNAIIAVQTITTFSDIYSYGDIEADGAITGESIGSFYFMQAGASSGSAGLFTYSQACKGGDFITGCNARINDTDNNDEFFGSSVLNDQKTCQAWAELKGPNLGSLEVTANCFDPNGIRTGKNPTN